MDNQTHTLSEQLAQSTDDHHCNRSANQKVVGSIPTLTNKIFLSFLGVCDEQFFISNYESALFINNQIEYKSQGCIKLGFFAKVAKILRGDKVFIGFKRGSGM